MSAGLRLITLLTMASAAFPREAAAHVKWFCSIVDVAPPPIALARVLTPMFAVVGLGFVALVFAGFVLDGYVARRWPGLSSSGRSFAETEERLIRLATGAFFLLLWDKGAFVLWERGDAILTPELMAASAWVGPLQFAIAVFTAWRSTCLLSAVGIGLLFGFGVAQFGLFHMTDYLFFPGLAGYLALTALGAQRLRVPLVSGTLAFSLMWTAIEKLVYPDWTLFVVLDHPGLRFGFPPDFVVVVAAFVEFTLAFYVMTGRGLVRFGAAAFAGIFIAAIPEFGHLDAVGHIPIVGILMVVGLRGASSLQRHMRIVDRGAIANAGAVAALYVVAMAGFVAMYYGLHAAQYGWASDAPA